MSGKETFSEEEWQKLLKMPHQAALAVMIASPSGAIGITKETSSLASAIADLIKEAPANTLLSALGEDWKGYRPPVDKGPDGKVSPEQQRAAAVTGAQEVSAILAKASPEEATAYRQFVVATVQRVAEAAKEGANLFGQGGQQVTPEEQAVVDEVTSALGA